MDIVFSPLRSDDSLSLHVSGDTVTFNGISFNFSQIAEGEILPASAVGCNMLKGNVTRSGGALQLEILLPYSPAGDVNGDGEITDMDVPEAIRFPAPLSISENGPISAPGLSEHQGITGQGTIDWSKLVTVAHQKQDRLNEWRASTSIPKLELLLNLVKAEIISEESAMSSDIPAEFMPIIDAMPNPPRAEIRIRWAHLVDVPRSSPFVGIVQNAFGWTDETVDGLFGWED